MDNSNEKESSTPIVPLLIGAAVGGALAYLFISNNDNEGDNNLTKTLTKSWESLKEKVPFIEDELNSFKYKILDTVKANIIPEARQGLDEVEEA